MFCFGNVVRCIDPFWFCLTRAVGLRLILATEMFPRDGTCIVPAGLGAWIGFWLDGTTSVLLGRELGLKRRRTTFCRQKWALWNNFMPKCKDFTVFSFQTDESFTHGIVIAAKILRHDGAERKGAFHFWKIQLDAARLSPTFWATPAHDWHRENGCSFTNLTARLQLDPSSCMRHRSQ